MVWSWWCGGDRWPDLLWQRLECGGRYSLGFVVGLCTARGAAQKTGAQEEQRLWGEGSEGTFGHQVE